MKTTWKAKHIKEKIKINTLKTCKEKYNVNNVFQILEIIEKIKNKRLNNIDQNGLNSYQNASIKIIQTKLNNIDENGLNSYQRGIIKQKQTNLEKYGSEYFLSSQQFKNYIKEHNDEIQQKIYQTKKKNNSFTKSKDEENIYNLLLQKFNKDDIIRQYKSKLYPFYSDFYIKSLDLYIEYHGTWAHGNKPFKNSVEDIKIVEKLKKKSKEINFKGEKKLQYLNALNVWTKSDPLKLQTFKKNKLNFKIFYNIEQFKNWFIKIKLG